MEFLYDLYSKDYFGIGLFIVITILAFSFLVILFFGKKDEKARNLEKLEKDKKNETVSQEVQKENKEEVQETSIEENTLEPISILVDDQIMNGNKEEIEEEYNTDTVEEINPFDTTTISLEPDYDVLEEPTYEENIVEDEIVDIPEDLHLDSEYQFTSQPEERYSEQFEEKEESPIFEAPIIEEQEENNIFSEPVEIPEEDEIPHRPFYEEKEEIVKPTPVRPTFELPKRNGSVENTSSINGSIFQTFTDQNGESSIDQLLNSEEETYRLDK